MAPPASALLKDVVVTKLLCQPTKNIEDGRSSGDKSQRSSNRSTSSGSSTSVGGTDKSEWSRKTSACQTEEGEVVLVASAWRPEADLWSFSQGLGYPGAEREARVAKVMASLLSEVRCLHNRGLAHGNLCLEAVLVAGSSADTPEDTLPPLKLTEFAPMKQGLGAFLSQGPSGKAMYVAPEAHENGDYDARYADLFACGVIAYSLSVGVYPFMNTAPGRDKAFAYFTENGTKALMARRKCTGADGRKVPVIDAMSGTFADAVSRLLSLDPEQRTEGLALLLSC